MPELNSAILVLEWSLTIYVVALNISYFALNVSSFVCASHSVTSRLLDTLPRRYAESDLPVSILIPAYNEEATITATVQSLLQIEYTEFELVVINDGSLDRTIEVLKKDFALAPVVESFDAQLLTRPIRCLYASSLHSSLRVIDKENGGKADALNAGINHSRNPIFCAIDADSILGRDSLHRAVQPFLDNPNTIACSGTVRGVNGCKVRRGFLVETGLPRNALALFQVVEYVRAFLFGRLGWLPLNSILVIPGAFGVFRKRNVVAVGGYQTDTVGEDIDLALRLHREHRLQDKDYSISYVPDAVCWTELPERMKTLKVQRMRWQRGLSEGLRNNRQLLCHPKGGSVGWIAMPFFVLFEWLSAFLETGGYILVVVGLFLGFVQPHFAAIFFVLAIGLGALNSTTAIFLDELAFHRYPKFRQVLVLFLFAVLENVGYRQLNALWRAMALIQFVRGRPSRWGAMARHATWQIR